MVIFDNRDIGKSSWLTEEPGFISFLKILPTFVIEYFVDFTLGFMFDEQGRFNMANPAPYEEVQIFFSKKYLLLFIRRIK